MMSSSKVLESDSASEEIRSEAESIRNTLSRIEEDCESKIDAIQRNADKEERPLRPEEKAERSVIREIQRDARNVHTALTYSTLVLLDDDESVERIERSLRQIVAGAKEDIDRLDRVRAVAEEVREVFGQIEGIANTIAGKAGS